MKDAILILGAAAVQMPLIRYVQSRGYRTIVVSIPGPYPGFVLADRCIYCDVRDGDAILAQTKDEHIVAVVTDQTDLSVPTVAYISGQLGLKSTKEETARIYSNKFAMRQACDRIGVPVPRYMQLSSVEEAKSWNIFPAIIKPEDNQGSRGIQMVNSYNDVVNAFDAAISFSRTGHAILEEFFVGDEVVVEGFVNDGVYMNWGIGDRKYFDLKRLFIPSQTIFPTNLDNNLCDKLLQSETLLHSKLRPASGMIHSEYLVNRKSGEIRLVETALRGGGVYISSHLIPLYCGYNNYELLLDAALGKPIDISVIEHSLHRKSSAYVCFYLPEGEITSISGVEELKATNGVVLADIAELQVGTNVNRMSNKTQRLGPILVTADSRLEIEKLISKVQQTLQIRVLRSDGNFDDIKWN